MKLFDTHAHYDDKRFDADRDAVLSALPEAGVALVVNPGCHMESSREAVGLAHRFPFLYAAVGVHPHDAEGMRDGDLAELEQMTRDERVVAIGEIGLDYHYDHSPRALQIARFRDQMDLARQTGLPVIVHDREAHEDTLRVLREFPQVTGVLHCYSGSREMAEVLIKMGFFLSFTGVVTYKNARKTLEVAAMLPDDRLMIETDAPYLAPEPDRRARNDSRTLPAMAEAIARVRGTTAEDIARLTLQNGKRFFGIG